MARGLVHVHTQGATAAVMIQENWGDSVQQDMLDVLTQQIPRGVWKPNLLQDGSGDAHDRRRCMVVAVPADR